MNKISYTIPFTPKSFVILKENNNSLGRDVFNIYRVFNFFGFRWMKKVKSFNIRSNAVSNIRLIGGEILN